MAKRWIDPDVKLARKGYLKKTSNGEFVLQNDNEQVFHTDDVVLPVWKMLDGKRTARELAHNITKKSHVDALQVEPELLELLTQLTDAGFIEAAF